MIKELEAASGKGMQQILDQHYMDVFLEDGYEKVRCYGIGFFRKQVRITIQMVDLQGKKYRSYRSELIK